MFNPLNWLKGKHIDSFSVELAQEFASRYPLEMAKRKPDKKLDKKLGRALDHVYRKAGEFRRRLGNGFKWQLREMGYRHEFIEEATKGLILSVRGQ
jgi:hypothetical protein